MNRENKGQIETQRINFSVKTSGRSGTLGYLPLLITTQAPCLDFNCSTTCTNSKKNKHKAKFIRTYIFQQLLIYACSFLYSQKRYLNLITNVNNCFQLWGPFRLYYTWIPKQRIETIFQAPQSLKDFHLLCPEERRKKMEKMLSCYSLCLECPALRPPNMHDLLLHIFQIFFQMLTSLSVRPSTNRENVTLSYLRFYQPFLIHFSPQLYIFFSYIMYLFIVFLFNRI